MWITRHEWDRLRERVDLLERQQREAEYRTQVYAEDPDRPTTIFSYQNYDPPKISASVAIRMILDHLGIRLHRHAGTPERFELAEAPQSMVLGKKARK